MGINFHLLILLLSQVASLQVNDTWETAWEEVKTNIELENILLLPIDNKDVVTQLDVLEPPEFSFFNKTHVTIKIHLRPEDGDERKFASFNLVMGESLFIPEKHKNNTTFEVLLKTDPCSDSIFTAVLEQNDCIKIREVFKKEVHGRSACILKWVYLFNCIPTPCNAAAV